MNITPKYAIFDSNNRLIGGAKTIESAEKKVAGTDDKILNLETKQLVWKPHQFHHNALQRTGKRS